METPTTLHDPHPKICGSRPAQPPRIDAYVYNYANLAM